MKNIGEGTWPDDTQLHVIEYDRAPFNNLGKVVKNMKCGSCKKEIFKSINFEYVAPDQPGLYVYKFRLGSET